MTGVGIFVFLFLFLNFFGEQKYIWYTFLAEKHTYPKENQPNTKLKIKKQEQAAGHDRAFEVMDFASDAVEFFF